MLMLSRIDELAVIIQQAVYIVLSGVLIGVELLELIREVRPPAVLRRVWKYREFVLHFALGTLLNSYAIFYFKSASGLSSFVFIAILAALLYVNEFLRFGKSRVQVHMAFLSLCLISYTEALAPILLGSLGFFAFICAALGAVLIFAGYYKSMKRVLSRKSELLRTHVLYPYLAVHIVFAGLYFANAIPPVPLSVTYMGIFHKIEKKDGEYVLSYTRPKWKFWQHGDETFLARPGDTVFCYAQVFSPTHFKEKLQVRWLHWSERSGWVSHDAIPLLIVGGREEGYRAVTKKENYEPGLWRVQIETLDNREIGRLKFLIQEDDETGSVEEKVLRSSSL